MEERIKERFNPAMLEEALRRYGVTPDRARLLDGFESFMYEFAGTFGEYILRIGHSLRRSEMLIQAEVDWINYLAAGGASVARAILSARDAWWKRSTTGTAGSSWRRRSSKRAGNRRGGRAGVRQCMRRTGS